MGAKSDGFFTRHQVLDVHTAGSEPNEEGPSWGTCGRGKSFRYVQRIWGSRDVFLKTPRTPISLSMIAGKTSSSRFSADMMKPHVELMYQPLPHVRCTNDL